MTDDDLEVALGRRVRDLRIAKRLTQARAAELANVSLGALKHLESGSGATTRTLTRVLRALGQDSWLDSLDPGPEAFNPLDLLAARQRSAGANRPRRVRSPRQPVGPKPTPSRRSTERTPGER